MNTNVGDTTRADNSASMALLSTLIYTQEMYNLMLYDVSSPITGLSVRAFRKIQL
jgi:hypothetical protein